jgi:TPR repeat protein
MRSLVLGVFASVLLASNTASAVNYAGLVGREPPGNFFPGKYLEYKAQFYLRNRDYRAALEMFELAGFWANKIAQYNAGLMYYNGIGVSVDKVRGVAWLGIAAEAHDDLADSTLQTAYASLSADEKRQADVLFRALDAKYGDRVSLPRALHRYDVEAKSATGSHVGFRGNSSVFESGSDSQIGDASFTYYKRQDEDRDKLVAQITGHVTIGTLQTLNVPDDARGKASTATDAVSPPPKEPH